jgi:hypothetical protein
MLSNVFNYVAGAASIISLVVALTPYFPAYKSYIRYMTVFFFGTLVGSLFATASSQAIVFQFEGSLIQVVLVVAAIIALSIVIVIILGVALGGVVKEYHKVSGGAAAVLFFAMLLLYGVSNLPSIEPRLRDTDENLAIARYQKQLGSISRALPYYCDALKSVRYTAKEKEIAQEVDAICSK